MVVLCYTVVICWLPGYFYFVSRLFCSMRDKDWRVHKVDKVGTERVVAEQACRFYQPLTTTIPPPPGTTLPLHCRPFAVKHLHNLADVRYIPISTRKH